LPEDEGRSVLWSMVNLGDSFKKLSKGNEEQKNKWK
jgi:hypothetical protein